MMRLAVAAVLSLTLSVVALAGCTNETSLPAATQTPPPPPAAPVTALPSPTPEPLMTTEPLTTTGRTPTPPADDAAAPGRLVSQWRSAPPTIDGRVDDVWSAADPLRAPLTWGLHGSEHALDVELRALHSDETVYFLAQWSGVPPSGQADTVTNKFTLHWQIPERAAQGLKCTVACHTAHADGDGRFVYANAETIPQGGHEALPAAGRWDGTRWTLEWSRPLASPNPFDLQLDDREQAYSFFVKVFEGIAGRPDPVSERYLLIFEP